MKLPHGSSFMCPIWSAFLGEKSGNLKISGLGDLGDNLEEHTKRNTQKAMSTTDIPQAI